MKTILALLGDLVVHPETAQIALPEKISCDSRTVTPGALFAAIRGVNVDAAKFIPSAVEKGAKVILSEASVPPIPGVTMIRVRDAAAAYSRLARARCGFPDETLDVIGVTGTNGKTSTAYFLRHILTTAHRRCGLVSTIETDDGKERTAANATTPAAGEFFALLQKMKQNGLDFAAMEVSSHSLDQRRLAGLAIKVAIFTNLTGDHLDYHGDMKNYFAAKKRLFTEYLVPDGCAVINVDDPYGARLCRELAALRSTLSFGVSPDAAWRISDVELRSDGSRFLLSSGATRLAVSMPLIGLHNIYNLAGALLAARVLGVGDGILLAAAANCVMAPGRLERYDLPGGAVAFVDYAHTDDALKNVLDILRRLGGKRLIVVFGAGGDRDRTKRPRMGRTVAENSDFAVVTSDNPRTENPESILDEIIAGIPEDFDFQRIANRRAAIEYALGIAEKGDIVLIAGKGHENYQEIDHIRHPFSDSAIIRDWTKK